jgi:hypothetical protein
MGTETIEDLELRNNWDIFINAAHQKLRENQIALSFSTFKNDGSYSKAKSGLPAVYFVFAQDSSRTWVELELKPRTSKGKRHPQTELYTFLKNSHKQESRRVILPITWIVEDIKSSPRDPDGLDIRIKMYLSNSNSEQRIDAMIQLFKEFYPLLNKYK